MAARRLGSVTGQDLALAGAFAAGLPLLLLWASCLASGALLVADGALAAILLALALTDLRWFLLPDLLTLPLALAGLAVTALWAPDDLTAHAVAAGLGFAAFALIGLAYRHLRGRDGLGLGDAKLLAAAGAWLGWEGLPSVVLIGAVVGLLHVLFAALAGRFARQNRIPFGTGLCAGFWLVWLHGPVGLGPN